MQKQDHQLASLPKCVILLIIKVHKSAAKHRSINFTPYKKAISIVSDASPLHRPDWFLPSSFRVDEFTRKYLLGLDHSIHLVLAPY